jgi:arabinose-5-phosphate isomerase
MERTRSDAQVADLKYANSILKQEVAAISGVKFGDDFLSAVQLCRCTQSGCIIVSGAGKSGIAAQKISATFSSLDIPSWYLHPNDAAHGDIGRIRSRDTIILISNSGETTEVVKLATMINGKFGRKPKTSSGPSIIAITASGESSLGRVSDIVLTMGHIPEAGSTALPTSSILAVIAIGDALAMVSAGAFTQAQYRANHPGGNIGKRFSKVDDFMRTGADCPTLHNSETIQEAVVKITKAGAGAAIVIVGDGKLDGIFTDGDLRRFLSTGKPLTSLLSDYMTNSPQYIVSGSLVEYALEIFGRYSIGDLPVVDNAMRPVGMLSLKDLSQLR